MFADYLKALQLNKVHQNCVTVEFVPSLEIRAEHRRLFGEDVAERASLIAFNGPDDFLDICPLVVKATDQRFMRSKYPVVQSIVLEGFGFGAPANIEETIDLLEQLPVGFAKKWTSLGLLGDYDSIIRTIESEGVSCVVVSKVGELAVNDSRLVLPYSDFEGLRKKTYGFRSRNRVATRNECDAMAHNLIFSAMDSVRYPRQRLRYTEELSQSITSYSESIRNLSNDDLTEMAAFVSEEGAGLARKNPSALWQLRDNVELVSLEYLIEQFDIALTRHANSESYWQRLFMKNPFILSLALGFPLILFTEQASTGGRSYFGKGDKVTDFLVKHSLTDNAAIVEIKTPKTKLLGRAYRDVLPSSRELSGSISQALDQTYRFRKEFVMLRDNADNRDIESYSLNCVLIIGSTPVEPNAKKAFELVRNNSKDIKIVTFDELLEQLRNLHEFLSSRRATDSTSPAS